MPRRAKDKSTTHHERSSSTEHFTLPLWRSTLLLLLTGITSTVLQLSLSPSHGDIPAQQYRNEVTIIFISFTILARSLGQPYATLHPSNAVWLLTCFTCWTPLLQLTLAPTARVLPPAWSAALVNAMTYGPMATIAVNAVSSSIHARLPYSQHRVTMLCSSCFASGIALMCAIYVTDRYIPAIIGLGSFLTRPVLPFLISPLMLALLHSRQLLWLLILQYSLALILNPHASFTVPRAFLDRTLGKAGYNVLTREESLTGYLAVIENQIAGYRVLRCDHSLLGGEWRNGLGNWPGGKGYKGPVGVLREPVYSVFVMLEAVRLVQDSHHKEERVDEATNSGLPQIADDEAKALVM